MPLPKTLSRRIVFGLVLLLALNLLTINSSFAQTADAQAQRAKALELADRSLYLEALPILEKIAAQFPKDADVWANYGIALLTNAVTLKTAPERKIGRKLGRDALVKAAQLGMKNVLALHFLETLPADGGDEDNLNGENPEVEKALREGEGFFGRGEYDKAFTAYEKAYKINPKNYEAVVFMGDSLYAQKKYKESEIWFARAVEIDPNREFAYRFWGDALYFQNKPKEAYQKFAEAFISEPFSRVVRDRFFRHVGELKGDFSPSVLIAPPGGEPVGAVKFDASLLQSQDGTAHWKLYVDTRSAWKATEFKKQFPKETVYRHSLAEETAALKKVADAVRKDAKIKILDDGLANLVKLDDLGLIESYILMMRIDDGIADDFFDYRAKNRDKLRRFINEFFIVF